MSDDEALDPGRIGHHMIVDALRERYDFHSARNILRDALEAAGMTPAESYTPEEGSRIVWGLNQLGERAQAAVMAMLELVGRAATAHLPEDDEEEPEPLEDAQMAQLIEAMGMVLSQKLREQARRAGAFRKADKQQTRPAPPSLPLTKPTPDDEDGTYWN